MLTKKGFVKVVNEIEKNARKFLANKNNKGFAYCWNELYSINDKKVICCMLKVDGFEVRMIGSCLYIK